MFNLNGLSVVVILVLVGFIALGLALAGTFSQTAAAQAEGIRMGNAMNVQREQFNLGQEQLIQQAKTQAEIQQLADNNRFNRQMNEQHLTQDARGAEQTATLKDWGVRILVGATAIALLILAFGITLHMAAGAWRLVAQAQADQASAHRAVITDQRDALLLKAAADVKSALYAFQKESAVPHSELNEFKVTLDKLQGESGIARETLVQVTMQVSEIKTMLAEWQARDKSTGQHEPSLPSDKIIRFKTSD